MDTCSDKNVADFATEEGTNVQHSCCRPPPDSTNFCPTGICVYGYQASEFPLCSLSPAPDGRQETQQQPAHDSMAVLVQETNHLSPFLPSMGPRFTPTARSGFCECASARCQLKPSSFPQLLCTRWCNYQIVIATTLFNTCMHNHSQPLQLCTCMPSA